MTKNTNNPFLSGLAGLAGLSESGENIDLNEHGDLDVATQGAVEEVNTDPMIGHNSANSANPATAPQPESDADFEVRALNAASAAGKLLGQAGKQAEKASNTVANAETLREQAATELYPVLEEMGIDREWGKDFAKKAKEIPLYNSVRENLCRAMSSSLKDLVEETEKGPKFSGRVLKAFSRFVTSYRENGKGGQTQADKDARAAEKERNTRVKEAGKAYLEDILPLVREDLDGNIDTIKTLLSSHADRFPAL